MPSPIRVLLVDDSVIVRRLLANALERHSDMTVVGTAADGAVALEMIDRLTPDVVVLDIEMPVMDGLETLRALRGRPRRPKVILFSSLTTQHAKPTFDALALGASDFVTKPKAGDSHTAVELELIPRIRALCAGPRRAATPVLPRTAIARPSAPAELVVIGASTGGPNAVAALLGALPSDFALPIMLVVHMPLEFTSMFAMRIAEKTSLRAKEAEDDEVLAPGCVYVAPGGRHLTVVNRAARLVTKLDDGPAENSCRPAVDVLFRSAAKAVGARAIAVVLTGMGRDGLAGSRALHREGATILAQDEATSVVWGMPGFVARQGLASAVKPVLELSSEIMRRSRRGRTPVGV